MSDKMKIKRRLAICALVLGPLVLTSLMSNAQGAEPLADNGQSVAPESVLVVIGASYAQGWPIQSLNGMKVVNRGVGGNQSFEMLARFEEHVVDLNPDAVIIWGFINDIFRSEPSEMNETTARIKSSYEKMHALAVDHGIDVVFASEVTIREPKGLYSSVATAVGRLLGKTSYQDRINARVVAVNEWMEAFAQSKSAPFLDFAEVLSGEDGRRKSEFAAEDGSHLTPDAYERLSEHSTGMLERAFAGDS